MELNNYRSVTPLKKKRRKITASAALVLCLLCLLIGILCGRAISSNKQSQENAQKIAQIEQEMNIEKKRFDAEIDAYKVEVNRLKSELADANKTIADKENEEEPQEVTPAENEEEIQVAKNEEPAKKEKNSGGFMKGLLIAILVIIIIVCILIATSLFLKKGDDEDDEEDEDYDEEYEDFEDDDDFEDEE